jgi:mannose-6-phosphate isomerase-like protein (cupin superfamily)
MNGPVNLASAIAELDGPFRPLTVGSLNDYKVMVVRAEGEFVWHKHDDTDDFFLVLDGQLTIRLRDGDVALGPGELFVVPRGVEHCPVGDARVLLIEPQGTPNTGDDGGPMTAPDREL